MGLFRKRKKEGHENLVYVIGDSHSRAFANNPNFFPLFLGPGKKINFISDEHAAEVQGKLKALQRNFNMRYVLTYFGEPDTRWFVGKGWYPWENKIEFTTEDFRPMVTEAVDRYIRTLNHWKELPGISLAVMNVTPTIREDQNVVMRFYNELLADRCKNEGLPFLSINPKIILDDGSLDESFCGDTVHLNNKIQPLVEDLLIEQGWLKEHKFDPEFDWNHLEVQGEYEYNERFGCFVQKSTTT